MKLSPRKLNLYSLLKLPAAYFTGVRVTHLEADTCVVKVRHRWVNQNPFKSMFWAVQGMAAELSTGALVIAKIQESKQQVSMLVASNNASFTKKATGLITFTCSEGGAIKGALDKAISTGEGQTVWVQSQGVNEDGIVVSTFNFQWTLKVRETKVQ